MDEAIFYDNRITKSLIQLSSKLGRLNADTDVDDDNNIRIQIKQ